MGAMAQPGGGKGCASAGKEGTIAHVEGPSGGIA